MKKAVVYVLIVSISLFCLAGCTVKEQVDVGLLEFPGLKWNSTPEEVKKTLELTESQIIVDEQHIPGADTYQPEYETWNLFVTDVAFLDTTAVGAHFTFIRYPGHEYGLMRIDLYLEDDLDMNTLKADLSTIYGEGSHKPADLYSFDQNGNLVISEQAETNTGDFPYYWYSTKKGTEVFSAEVIRNYVEYATNSNIGATQEAALEYIAKYPLVTVDCGTENIRATLADKFSEPNPYITQNYVSFIANFLIHQSQKYGK